MGIVFNANEVFEMAKRIEANGGRFYRRAAEQNTEGRDLLLKIADQEDQHLATFEQMQQQLTTQESESTAYDPYEEGDLYLKAMADGRVFDIRKDPSEMLKGNESLRAIVDFAIGIEKDSIVFYVGLKEMVPTRLGPDKIQKIIREEMKHIGWLNECLSREKVI